MGDFFQDILYFPQGKYNPNVRKITPRIRLAVDQWIEGINGEDPFYTQVIEMDPLALRTYRNSVLECYNTILNQVLDLHNKYIDVRVLQLMASAAYSIALKTTLGHDLDTFNVVRGLVQYSGGVYTHRELLSMELDMLEKTNWGGCHGVVPTPVEESKFVPPRLGEQRVISDSKIIARSL